VLSRDPRACSNGWHNTKLANPDKRGFYATDNLQFVEVNERLATRFDETAAAAAAG